MSRRFLRERVRLRRCLAIPAVNDHKRVTSGKVRHTFAPSAIAAATASHSDKAVCGRPHEVCAIFPLALSTAISDGRLWGRGAFCYRYLPAIYGTPGTSQLIDNKPVSASSARDKQPAMPLARNPRALLHLKRFLGPAFVRRSEGRIAA
ncbi:hypothetical protein MTO96_020799 [Rhipicephalus appendiculatus]